jgi:hypothetical protein
VLETLPEGFTVSLEDVVEGVTKPLLWFFCIGQWIYQLPLATAFRTKYQMCVLISHASSALLFHASIASSSVLHIRESAHPRQRKFLQDTSTKHPLSITAASPPQNGQGFNSAIFRPHFLKPPTIALARFGLLPEILAHTLGVRGLPDGAWAIAIVRFDIRPDAGVYLDDFKHHASPSAGCCSHFMVQSLQDALQSIAWLGHPQQEMNSANSSSVIARMRSALVKTLCSQFPI